MGRRGGSFAKRKGSRTEAKSRAWLEEQGFEVTKSGGSLGKWDLIAVGVLVVLLVQVKANRPPPRAEMEALRAAICPPGAKKLIHVWRDRAREPDVMEVS